MKQSTRYKRRRLYALAQVRRAERWNGYTNLDEYHQGFYECNHVSPYTLGASNVDADVLLLLQDWSSRDWLLKNRSYEVRTLGHEPKLATNKKVQEVLLKHLRVRLCDTYATNLFPLIKPGPLSTKIRMSHLVVKVQ